MDEFSVKTEVFEGPLDLLLNLIEKRKLLINDLSLAQITDDYIQYLKNNPELSIKKNSHFILIASTLLLIKSKSLLPTLELTEEEENSIQDLERRLKIYKRIKDTEKFISDLFGKKISFFGGGVVYTEKYFLPNHQTTTENLYKTIKGVILALPKFEKRPKVTIQNVISLETMITKLSERISSNINLKFKDFAGYGKTDKVNVIVSFLAMLELVKEGVIDAVQHDNDDIEMQTKVFNTPKYS